MIRIAIAEDDAPAYGQDPTRQLRRRIVQNHHVHAPAQASSSERPCLWDQQCRYFFTDCVQGITTVMPAAGFASLVASVSPVRTNWKIRRGLVEPPCRCGPQAGSGSSSSRFQELLWISQMPGKC